MNTCHTASHRNTSSIAQSESPISGHPLLDRERFQKTFLNQKLTEISARKSIRRGVAALLAVTLTTAAFAFGSNSTDEQYGFDGSIAPAAPSSSTSISSVDLTLDDPRDLPLPPAMEYGL